MIMVLDGVIFPFDAVMLPFVPCRNAVTQPQGPQGQDPESEKDARLRAVTEAPGDCRAWLRLRDPRQLAKPNSPPPNDAVAPRCKGSD